MKSAIDGADQPSTNNVLEQLLEVSNHSFNFCKKISVNMGLMQSNVARMATYGIIIGIPQLTLTLLANIETATKSNYGCEFFSAMYAIRKKYTYNLLQFILKELAGADGGRVLKDAPAPGTGTTHLVAKSLSYLQVMMGEDTNFAYTESAYGESYNSDSSKDECMHASARNPNAPSCEVAAGNRRRKKMTSQRRMRAPTAKSSIARNPIKSNQTSACGTRSTRATDSNLSATSLKWHSNHTTNS
jgi:hypothetical protein